jgi:hypothetical protein
VTSIFSGMPPIAPGQQGASIVVLNTTSNGLQFAVVGVFPVVGGVQLLSKLASIFQIDDEQ